jgi:hypothetical protein
MMRHHSQQETENEAVIQQALDDIRAGLYRSAFHAAQETGAKKSTLCHRTAAVLILKPMWMTNISLKPKRDR